MAYSKTNWVNGTTPLNDKNMNKIENELENLDTNMNKKANSADVYNKTEIDTKLDTKANTTDISKIKEEQTTQNENISKNADEITALQTENSRLKGITNAMPKVTGEDTSLTLSNTANSPFNNITLKGNTSQQKYSGKNQLQFINELKFISDGITSTVTKNGYQIKFDGTTKSSAIVNQDKNIQLPQTGTYYLVCQIVSGSFSSNNFTFGVNFGRDNAVTFNQKENKGIVKINATKTLGYIPLFSPVGTTFDNLVINMQVISKNELDLNFEPYVGGTASPNPDYPQDIKVVTGNNQIIVSGKNLLPPDNNTSTTINGVTFTRNSDGSVLVNGTATANAQYITSKNFMLEDGKTYILSGCPNGGSTSTYMLNINQYYNNTSHVLNNIGYNQKFTYVLDSKNSNSIYIYIVSGTKCDNLLFKPMVSINGGDYEPYVGRQDFPISLGSLELCKIGEYKDYIFKENNKWYKHKVIGKIVFDGTRTGWGFGTAGLENMNVANINIPSMLIQNFGLGFCNFFIRGTSKEINTLRFGANDSHLWFYVNATEFTNINDWKTWLSNNNITVYYVLSTPIEEEITDTTLISQLNELEKAVSYDDTTNISQTNANLPFIINAEAVKKLL